jgi:3-oxoacyl-[acyl-carrier protein] reductase
MRDQGARRVAVVTGAGRGIGRAIARRLARDGRHVVLVGRTEAPLADLRGRIEGEGMSASIVLADVGRRDEWRSAVERIIEEHDRLDVLVNNAGIARDNLSLRMSDEEWDEVLAVNLTAAFVGIRAAARAMMRHRFGRIVNIGSTTGLVGNAGQANYAAAKAGLVGLTRTIARELGGKGITCNVVVPGWVETDMTQGLPAEVRERVREMCPVRRLGTPDDIASAVGYVASDEAGFLTGQVLTVDGGMTMA